MSRGAYLHDLDQRGLMLARLEEDITPGGSRCGISDEDRADVRALEQETEQNYG